MTIAVHIHFSNDKKDPKINFNYRCFTIIAATYPEHQFIFFFDTPFNVSLITQKNIQPVLLAPQIKNRLLGYYWYNFKLPALLNKFNADLFVSNGINGSFRSNVKQCIILQDLSFLNKGNLFSSSDARYFKKFFKKIISKVSYIALSNDHNRAVLSNLFPETKELNHVIGFAANDPDKTFDFDEKENIKSRYTKGKEYFLSYITDGSLTNTTILLKAFSTFKKRQLSNMQLVLVIFTHQKESPLKDLSSYKYRDDVKLLFAENDDQLAEITAAAYAAIYLPAFEYMDDIGIATLKNNIPLIISKNDFNKSLYVDAAIYTTMDEKNIAENMMQLYKNEHTRNEQIQKGKELTTICTWENTAFNLWKAIQEATEK